MRKSVRRVLLASIAACCGLVVAVGAAQAAPTTIDFESLTGPPVFTAPDPPVTIGNATFTGGQILTAETNLPADQTTVYGTISDFGTPGITINFSSPVANFSTLVLNGNIVTVTYTVSDNTGGAVTKSLVANFLSGADTFSLPDVGITSVTVTTTDSFFDFSIDNVSFTTLPTSKDQCKKGGWQSYGVFKNQGDCVSYVATKGKNPPANS